MNKDCLNNTETKTFLINYLFHVLELSRFKYKLIKEHEDLQPLQSKKYYVSGNFSGINSLLIFIKLRGKSYSFTIDRRTLGYSISTTKFENVKLYPVRVRLEEDVYNGTIFDGTFVNTDGKREFIIYDVYYLRGKDLTSDNIYYKMLNLVSYFTKYYTHDTKLSNLELVINRLYKLEELDLLLDTILPTVKNVKGIAFHPEVSNKAQKLIYLFQDKTDKDRSDKDKKSDLSPVKNDINAEDTAKLDSSKLEDNQVLTFKMKPTKVDDVYKLYLVVKSKKTDKTVIKNVKVDIAYIPNIATSNLCRKALENREDALVDCQYNRDKNKWTPVKVNKTKEFPSLINDYV